ncbi:MAG: RHS repeat-associated core domain-containing protein [Candidatus Thiodiazotropha sp.]
MGRRIRKQTQSEIVYFHYTDEGLVGEFSETGSPLRIYGYQPDSTWTTDPIYQKTTQGYAYYQNDHLGMPQQLIQKNGAKVWEGEFRAFGGIITETGTWENRLRFPGQYFDQETNKHHNYFRDYDPSTGRYIESDPIGLKGGINRYAYVGGNPIIDTDVLGLVRDRTGPTGYPCTFIAQEGPTFESWFAIIYTYKVKCFYYCGPDPDDPNCPFQDPWDDYIRIKEIRGLLPPTCPSTPFPDEVDVPM